VCRRDVQIVQWAPEGVLMEPSGPPRVPNGALGSQEPFSIAFGFICEGFSADLRWFFICCEFLFSSKPGPGLAPCAVGSGVVFGRGATLHGVGQSRRARFLVVGRP
jgi:hypothetical protein